MPTTKSSKPFYNPCPTLPAYNPKTPGRRAVANNSVVSSPEQAVLVFGEALFDCLADQKGVPREQVKTWTPYPGGAPANVAAALGKLGAKVGFITAFGNDDLAKQMQQLLEDRGVDLSAAQFVERPTRDVLVIFDSEGDREFIGFGSAEANEFADCYIAADKLPESTVKNAKFLVTGTLGLAYPKTGEAMRRAVSLSKEGPCQVLIDVNWRPVFFEDDKEAKGIIMPFVEQGDILKMSDEEAEWLYDIPRDEALHHPEKVLDRAASAKGVLLTAGGLGSSYAFRKADGAGVSSGYVPVMSIEVQDTTGAGDAYLAGFLYSVTQADGLEALQKDEKKLRKAVEFATACGAFTTTQLGGIDAQPSKEQAEELLSKASSAK
jgi:fructokinase